MYFLRTIVLCLGLLALGQAANIEKAICHVQGTSVAPELSGTVVFTASGDEVQVDVVLGGLPVNPTEFAIHVHVSGDITAADGTSTGGHFNPTGANHTCPDGPRHVGDMGNWNAASGSIEQTKTLDLLALTGANSIIGRAVTVHAGVDDCTTQPTGAAGARLGVCVIGVANPADDTNLASPNEAADIPHAVAVLAGTSNCPECSGLVYFESTPTGIQVTAVVEGLPENTQRAIHIHQFGDLSSETGTAAGSHFNPDDALHNIPEAEPRHRGDLGSMTGTSVTNPNSVYYDKLNTWIRSVDSILGRALIIHAGQDNGDGFGCDQAGSAGGRILQGVIGVAGANTAAPPIPEDTQNLDAVQQSLDCEPRPLPTEVPVVPVPVPSASARPTRHPTVPVRFTTSGGSMLFVSLALVSLGLAVSF